MMGIIKALFGIIVITWLMSSTRLLAETTIYITNGEWEPFLSEYSYQYGIDSHIVAEAFRLEGIKVKWGFFPWKRAYQEAKHGKRWDASCCWWPTKKTKEAFYISDVVSETSFVFFHLKSYKFDWNTIDDLQGVKIGGTLEYDYGEAFMNAMEEERIHVELVRKDEMNYKKILAGRIQIFPNDPLVGYSQLKNTVSPSELALFTHHPKEFEISTLSLIISKKSKNGALFLSKFNAGLKKLKESGQLDRMLKDFEAGKYDKQPSKWKAKTVNK